MTQRVEQILAASRAQPIGGDGARIALLDIRNDQEQLLELLERVIDECGSTSGGWMLPPVCGWLPLEGLARAAAAARRHLQEHSGCRNAAALLLHESLRRPSGNPPATLHVAFPGQLVQAWWDRWPLRTDHPTWVARAPEQPDAAVGGPAASPCPRCDGPGETLLAVAADDVPAIDTRASVEFIWCPGCSPFTEATYALVDDTGQGALMELETMVDIEVFPGPEPYPRTHVGLVDLGGEWRVQDWVWSNNVENLHRVGGLPTWIQGEATPGCRRCGVAMAFVGQIAVEDLTFGEGMTYLSWCDDCSVTAVVYQQT